MYKLLKQAKIPVEYEGKTFSLVEGFDFTNASYNLIVEISIHVIFFVIDPAYLRSIFVYATFVVLL
jgi:hypothetical protein